MDMSQYLELFLSETKEHLRQFNDLIVALEGDADDREKIDALFRTAHSIKGMAASMGYGEIAELSHKIEDLMEKVRKKVVPFEPALADLVLEGADLLEVLVNDVERGGSGSGPDLAPFLARLVAYPGGEKEVPSPAVKEATPGEGELEEQPVEERRIGERRVEERRKGKEHPETRPTVRIRTAILDNLINTTGELITNKHRLLNAAGELSSPPLHEALHELSRLLRELQNEVMNVRLMPFSSLTDRFPRVVRDLARKSGKDVAFEILGKEIEIDRGTLEELADPVIHILRNAVDHGIETEADRVAAGKDPKGTVTLSAVRRMDQVVITVEDDGKGMDPARLISSAIAKGIITSEEGRTLSKRDALLLTCRPGFSTAREITDVSGRGVGMDVAFSTIRSLGGALAIESEPGVGSKIVLSLPVTVAIINVLLVASAGLTLAVPVTAIHHTSEIRPSAISQQGRHKVFHLEGEPVPLLSMNRILGAPPPAERGRVVPLFVTEAKGRKVALVVERFLGHQEVFVKPLGRPLGAMKGMAGGAILGNGQVVFILDLANIL